MPRHAAAHICGVLTVQAGTWDRAHLQAGTSPTPSHEDSPQAGSAFLWGLQWRAFLSRGSDALLHMLHDLNGQ